MSSDETANQSTARRRTGCGALLAVALIAALAGGVWFYRSLLSQVNFAGSVGRGGEATLTVPDGFKAGVFAAGLSGPRHLAFGPDGTLYVAERGAGRIVALPDTDGDGRADSVVAVAEGLNQPHSLAWHEGAWYAGVPSGVVRLEDADGDGAADSQRAIVDDLPTGGSHRTRTVAFLPDGRMVISVGSSCNACVEDDPRRAAVLIYDADGGNGRLFAGGLRNAVGLAIHPDTGELWAADNGRDLLGDDQPPETLHIIRDGAHYGWPTCHAGTITDPELGGPDACAGVEQPILTMQAHVAPLGLAFYTGDVFPAAYRGDLFIATHGSWNRSVPVGYEVLRVPFEGGRPSGPAETFAAGWLDASGRVRGRPVGVTAGPDGALYVSDDRSGFIYRIAEE